MFAFIRGIICIFTFTIYLSAAAQAEEAANVAELRAALQQLRQEYETRVQALEQRINDLSAQQQTAQVQPQAAPAIADGGVVMQSASSAAAFNPAMGIIFQGLAWSGAGASAGDIPGFPMDEGTGASGDGMLLGETELDFSANVDDKFTARLTMPITVANGDAQVELEEAWLETLALPAGLAARFGRFFSGIGYLNDKHSHAWDFVDQPLPYQAFLGGQYLDDGIQLRWIAPLDLYLELGGEVLRGDRYPAAGATDSGLGSRAAFAHVGGDASVNSSWLAGLSYLYTGSDRRRDGTVDQPMLFSGDSDVLIADFVWKWAPQGNWHQKNLVLQAEYLWRNEDGTYTLPGGRVLPYSNAQDGWYVQAVYQPVPRWRAGGRFDMLSSGDPGTLFTGTPLQPAGDDPMRFTLMADWSNSEYSRLRLQFAHQFGVLTDNQWGLQYILSIGAHGAHTF